MRQRSACRSCVHWPAVQPSVVHSMPSEQFRAAPAVAYRRERIETEDGDVLDLDWLAAGGPRLAILSYGMESTPQSAYVRATAAHLAARNIDVLVWNYRGCGGEPNRKVHFYHGGLYQDLEAVVRHAMMSETDSSDPTLGRVSRRRTGKSASSAG